MESVSLSFIISGLLVGGVFGLILQRGRFCMNSAFRDTIFIKEFTMFHAYLLAFIVTIIGAQILNDLGYIHLRAQSFFPLANIIGGFVFGIGMVLAGGCGSGITYRVGEGQLASWFAVFGFFLGIGATTNGILNPVYKLLRSVRVGDGAITLHGLVGGDDSSAIKWGVILVVCAICFIFTLKSKPFKLQKSTGFYWSVSGILVGLICVVTFWASEYFGSPGFARGANFTTPTGEFFFTVLTGDARSRFFPMFDLMGLKVTWAVFFYIGVPLGAFLSAKMLKEFKWKTPRDAGELLTVLGGSLLMGFGASTAGGCNVGQALTGAATLSIGSLVATIAIILGNWTMVYFKFIKPMDDM